MAGELEPGDKVTWNTPQGETTGKVKKKVTAPTRAKGGKAKGQKVAASDADPRYLVASDKSGKEAAHKASALRKGGAKGKKKEG